MLAKMLPVALALVGTGAGVGAGIALRPDPAPAEAEIHPAATPCGEVPAGDPSGGHATGGEGHATAANDHAAPADGHGAAAKDSHAAADDGHGDGHGGGDVFVELDQQFIVPVIAEGRVNSMVVMSVTLEVAPETQGPAQERQPRIHDRFLRVMLDHANSGGFDGTFTANGAMDRLRQALLETGRNELGSGLNDILILDLNRQEV